MKVFYYTSAYEAQMVLCLGYSRDDDVCVQPVCTNLHHTTLD